MTIYATWYTAGRFPVVVSCPISSFNNLQLIYKPASRVNTVMINLIFSGYMIKGKKKGKVVPVLN
jgi:hypothetical protein